MLSEPLLIVLYDISDNILYAQELLSGVTYQDFTASRTPFYAATRALEIISEASRRLPDELLERQAHLPWRAIRDSGNAYRHRYDHVDRIPRVGYGACTPSTPVDRSPCGNKDA